MTHNPPPDARVAFLRRVTAFVVGLTLVLVLLGFLGAIALIHAWSAAVEPVPDGVRVIQLQRDTQARPATPDPEPQEWSP